MTEAVSRRQFVVAAGAAGAAVATGARAAEPTRQVTLGLVGCAHIHTPAFVRLLASWPDVRVKWAFDEDPARVARWGGEVKAATAPSAEAVFADPEVQGVIICSQTDRHGALVAGAARAGKHMFVEKPLAGTARESKEMADAIEKAGVRFTTGYFMRTDPKHLYLREQVSKGAFGTITRASAWNCHAGSLKGWFDEKPGNVAGSWRWMADPKVAGVGAFGDLGTHSLDILMWLLGDVESANAEIRVITGRYGDCDETGTALLRFQGGAVATLIAGWVDVANPVTLQLAGTEGHALIVKDALYFQSAKVPGSSLDQPVSALPPAPPPPLRQFVDAVAGKVDQPLVTPREAAARVAVMEAAYVSARSGQWTKVS